MNGVQFHKLADEEAHLGIPITFSVDSNNAAMCAQVRMWVVGGCVGPTLLARGSARCWGAWQSALLGRATAGSVGEPRACLGLCAVKLRMDLICARLDLLCVLGRRSLARTAIPLWHALT